MTAAQMFDLIEDFRQKYDLDKPEKWHRDCFAIFNLAQWALNEFESCIVADANYMLDTGIYEYTFDLSEPEAFLYDLIDTYCLSPRYGPAIAVWEDILTLIQEKEGEDYEEVA